MLAIRVSKFHVAKVNKSEVSVQSSRLMSSYKYTKDHEWILVDGKKAKVGISDFAQTALGDVVYVDLPEVGKTFKQKETIVAVESVKVAISCI
jgi:glycine cleavage system H lipoate-binding protein